MPILAALYNPTQLLGLGTVNEALFKKISDTAIELRATTNGYLHEERDIHASAQ